MKPKPLLSTVIFLLVFALTCCSTSADTKTGVETTQVPEWSASDLEFFLHGSMSTEVVPEAVLRAFISTYPDLFPNKDLGNLGLLPDSGFGWPIGFSRRPVRHLGGLS